MSSRSRKRLIRTLPDSPQIVLPFPDTDPQHPKGSGQAVCFYCGRLFQAPVWVSRERLQVVFCGQACRKAWEEVPEEDVLRLGGRPEHRGGDWEIWAKKARERDGFSCRGCGAVEEVLGKKLHVHHIVPYRLFPLGREANRLDNLISLCPACHARTEAEGLDALPLFSKIRRQSGLEIRIEQVDPNPESPPGD